MIKIALFASGNGSNAENVFRYFEKNSGISFGSIYCNKANAYVLERAKTLGISSFVFDKNGLENPEIVLKKLRDEKIDLIILCGFLLKIPEIIISHFDEKIINIHPALLPKYGGKGMYGMNVHNAVKENKESKSGITIHLVNEKYDEGSILFQAECDVLDSDTADDIANKVHQLEYAFFPEIINTYIKEQLNN